MPAYKTVETEGKTFVASLLKKHLKAFNVKNATVEESVLEAARLAAVFAPKTAFDANGMRAKPTRKLVGTRIRTYVPGEFSAVQLKLTHSDRKHGEPSEHQRMKVGRMAYFVQLYGNKSYVVLDVERMRALNLFDEGAYTVVEGTSNGGAYAYAEYALRDLAKAGVIEDASNDIKAFFGL